MKVLPPKPFTFEAGKRAVLLLHGFTGNSADVRMLGRFLQDRGYTSHAPHYKGHGVPPEELLKTDPEDWWEDVTNGYKHLKNLGYDEIAVAGLSLGGVFSLKVGYTFPVKGIVPMCTPMSTKTEEKIRQGVIEYAQEWKQLEGKSKEQIEREMKPFKDAPMKTLAKLSELIEEVRAHIDLIYNPIFVVQGRLDKMIDTNSANIIYETVESEDKQIKWYKQSGHVITLGDEKAQLHQDIYDFLEGLDWSDS
ncbi:carboxylesterase [Pullulanibacillus camelliae]|uniref:Carboxylesterase n=1 Tax=Pullulanibacillus camelliae TaxID=1707096 RepID=A0A8J2YCF4_9BACL|nr:carboxylesterase [Pullulanibacillus camelliae]GGE36665.1 carboxylesterase [Pullulanibacillus camelliae]